MASLIWVPRRAFIGRHTVAPRFQRKKGRALPFVSRFPCGSTAMCALSFVFSSSSSRVVLVLQLWWCWSWGRNGALFLLVWVVWTMAGFGRGTVLILLTITIVFQTCIHCDPLSVLDPGNGVCAVPHLQFSDRQWHPPPFPSSSWCGCYSSYSAAEGGGEVVLGYHHSPRSFGDASNQRWWQFWLRPLAATLLRFDS